MAVFPKQRSVGEICSKIICVTDFLFLFFAFWFLSLHATTINSHKGTHRIRDSSGQDANNRHLTSAAEQLKYLRWEGLFAWKQRTESKAGPGSCEDEDDGDVGNTTLGTILSHGVELWRTAAVCNSDSKYSSTYSSQSGIRVSVYAWDSPRSILRMRGLHCLWPLQPRSSMSCTCIWFRTCRSSVFTALINCKHTNTHSIWTNRTFIKWAMIS